MLRASIRFANVSLNVRSVIDDAVAPEAPDAAEILAFTTALVTRDDDRLGPARDALVSAIGPDGASKISAVTGNFEMMNRILDATGVPAA